MFQQQYSQSLLWHLHLTRQYLKILLPLPARLLEYILFNIPLYFRLFLFIQLYRFAKAVFFSNNAEFMFASQEEQNVANNSKRLIQNAVILWNYLYINKKIQQAKSQFQKDEIIEALKNSSIVHWSHVNFYGTYDFTKVDKKVSAIIS